MKHDPNIPASTTLPKTAPGCPEGGCALPMGHLRPESETHTGHDLTMRGT